MPASAELLLRIVRASHIPSRRLATRQGRTAKTQDVNARPRLPAPIAAPADTRRQIAGARAIRKARPRDCNGPTPNRASAPAPAGTRRLPGAAAAEVRAQ